MDFVRYDALDVSHIAVAVKPLALAGHLECPVPDLTGHLAMVQVLPVVDSEGQVVRLLHDTDLIHHGADIARLIGLPSDSSVVTLPLGACLQEARQSFIQHPALNLIPLVDPTGRYTGECASKAMLLRLVQNSRPKPPRLGGMATPFGVYMTSGRLVGGAGLKGLLATGALFALAIFTAQSLFAGLWIGAVWVYPPITQLNEAGQILCQLLFTLGFILLGIRYTPMSGLHAAEHMTINAVEAGLPLTVASVQVMPRVHIRCGTNLMALIGGIQIAWLSLETIRPFINPVGEVVYTVLAVILVASMWKSLGVWLQTHFTTRTPTTDQLQSGIRAGQDVLNQYEAAPHKSPSLFRRLLTSGILHLILVFSATMWLLENGVWWLLGQLWR